MQIKVNPHTIELTKNEIVNEGEYNINTCYFEFSEEYQNLTNIAIFTNGINSYNQLIVNNQCLIPSEVLENQGTVGLGVYGYEADGDNLIKRYSPTPVTFYVEKGSYTMADEPTPPSPSVVEQLQSQITENANNITTLQGLVSANTQSIETINQTLPTLATKDEIPIKVSELENDSGFIDKNVNDLTNYTKTSNLSEVATSGNYNDLNNKPDLSPVATSGAYNDLTGTPDLSVYATNQALGTETTNRENADIGLQGQIDAITSSSDVKDIVGAYSDLQNYDTSSLGNNDVIKVLQDSTHNNAMTYYRWVITGGTGSWQYIGQEGPYYTKSEIDTTLQGYVEDSDLADYVKNTDYATNNKGGVIKTGQYSIGITNGYLTATNRTYAEYGSMGVNHFIGKGTLDNVLNAVVGDINTALDTINGEVI